MVCGALVASDAGRVGVRFDNYLFPAKVRGSLAQMAELVDALGSGPSGGNTVEVRVLFWAPLRIPIAVPGGSSVALRVS